MLTVRSQLSVSTKEAMGLLYNSSAGSGLLLHQDDTIPISSDIFTQLVVRTSAELKVQEFGFRQDRKKEIIAGRIERKYTCICVRDSNLGIPVTGNTDEEIEAVPNFNCQNSLAYSVDQNKKKNFLLLEFAERWQPCYSSIFSFGLVKTVHARLATRAGGKVVICLNVGDLSRLHLTEETTKYVLSHPKTLCKQTLMKTSFDMLRHY
uniref:Uncharacterized protein n=1 Tax=Timema poppense TaxID=170557 RepID=A0A7R9D4Z6_TIMPO|nr:unnamed protein product [Timema poppensis]